MTWGAEFWGLSNVSSRVVEHAICDAVPGFRRRKLATESVSVLAESSSHVEVAWLLQSGWSLSEGVRYGDIDTLRRESI